jgi:hypothetical protein
MSFINFTFEARLAKEAADASIVAVHRKGSRPKMPQVGEALRFYESGVGDVRMNVHCIDSQASRIVLDASPSDIAQLIEMGWEPLE